MFRISLTTAVIVIAFFGFTLFVDAQTEAYIPDFIVDSVRFDPLIPVANNPADVYVTVKNIGGTVTGLDAGVTIEVLNHSTDMSQKLTFPIDTDTWTSGTTKEKDVGTITFASSGVKGLHFKLIPVGEELDMTNNEVSYSYSIGGSNFEVDFEVSSARFMPEVPEVGEPVTPYVSVVNNGSSYSGYWRSVSVQGEYVANTQTDAVSGMLEFTDWGSGEVKEIPLEVASIQAVGGIPFTFSVESNLTEMSSSNNSSNTTLTMVELAEEVVEDSVELPPPPVQNIDEPQLYRPTSDSSDLRRAHGDTKVYRIVRGHRIWIPTAEVFNNQRLDWGAIRDTSHSEVDSVPLANLIRTLGDKKVYLIAENGYKRHVPNPSVFESYGYKWEDVLDVENAIVDAFPINVLVRVDGDEKVYKLENGTKRWIKTSAAFERTGFSWYDVGLVNQAELDAHPEGASIE